MAGRQNEGRRGLRPWEKALIAVLAVAAVACLAVSIKDILSKSEDRSSYDEAAETYTADAPSAPSDTASPADTTSAESPAGVKPSIQAPISVDFEALTAAAPDVVGWIYAEGTTINYPIVRGEDNEFYLAHDYTGRRSNSGSIMMHCLCSGDWTDINTILYGHSMANGTMFEDIRNWFNKDFFNTHPYIWILTPEKTFRVEIFAARETMDLSDVYTVFLIRGASFEKYLRAAVDEATFSREMDLSTDDNYIVLSTCKHATGAERLVLHGKLVEV